VRFGDTMKGVKGKSPAIQWYYKDWLSDKKLQRASASSRGIWINILMYMLDDDGDNKGTLEDLTLREIANLGSSTEDEAGLFIEEAKKLTFCDICVTGHGVSYIKSRRIIRDDRNRLNACMRKRDQRNKEAQKDDVTDMSQKSHNPSPTPTPTPTPTKRDIHMCPYLQIIEIYHTTLPNLPEVNLNDNLKKRIKARWKEHKVLSWWQWYFDGVSECPYLMGQVNDWAANFHWLLGPKNMTKVLNGAYVDRKNMKEKQIFDNFDKWLKGRENENSGQ